MFFFFCLFNFFKFNISTLFASFHFFKSAFICVLTHFNHLNNNSYNESIPYLQGGWIGSAEEGLIAISVLKGESISVQKMREIGDLYSKKKAYTLMIEFMIKVCFQKLDIKY